MVFDEATTEHHRTARFAFVPWLVRLLDEGPIRGESAPLPVGKAEALTDETVVAIQEIASRACWRFLIEECGWIKLDAVNPADPDSHGIRRLWENHRALPNLEFSTATPDLLLRIFNGTRKKGDLLDLTMPDCVEANGDLLIHHLVFQRIHSAPAAFGMTDNYSWQDWLTNPLNAFCEPLGYRTCDPTAVRWDRICDPDLAPFIPWIEFHLAKGWIQKIENFWARGINQGLSWIEALTFLISDLGVVIEKSHRCDLICFLIGVFQAHEKHMFADLATFNQHYQGKPLRERQDDARVWADLIAVVNPLEETARKCLDSHPIERSGAEKCFLARWEATDFSSTIVRLRELSQALRPSFN